MKNNDIFIIYGKDIKAMTKELLKNEDFGATLPNKSASIILKPNLVVATTPDSGATTHLEIMEGIIEHLQGMGYRNITIAEGSWVGDRTKNAFRINGYDRFTKNYGVPLVDLKDDEYRHVKACGFDMEISETILDADYLINLPVLKGHCQTYMTGAMKNLKGCLSDRSKRMFHAKGLMYPIAALNKVLKPSLTIMDSICGDLEFEEGGNPVQTDRLLMAKDTILLDSYGASLLGFTEEEVEYISIAKEMGMGQGMAEIHELSKPLENSLARSTRAVQKLSAHTLPDSACSACYANLIHALKRLDDSGELRLLGSKRICIGQGYKGKEMEIGVGACCSKAQHSAKGCPPPASAIMSMLRDQMPD